jgi:hypothetical protein
LTDLSIAVVQPQNNVLVNFFLALLQNLLLLVHAHCFMRLEAVDVLALELAMGTKAFLHPDVRTFLLQHFQPLLLKV